MLYEGPTLLCDADRCLQSDVVTESRLQGSLEAWVPALQPGEVFGRRVSFFATAQDHFNLSYPCRSHARARPVRVEGEDTFDDDDDDPIGSSLRRYIGAPPPSTSRFDEGSGVRWSVLPVRRHNVEARIAARRVGTCFTPSQ